MLVRAFVSPVDNPPADERTHTISKGGVERLLGWRADGKEVWYGTTDGSVVGVDTVILNRPDLRRR